MEGGSERFKPRRAFQAGKPHLQRHAVLRADEWGRGWGEFCVAGGVQSAGQVVEDEAGEEHEARM